MALVQLSGLLTSLNGSIGGTTFQNTAAGLIARNKPMGRKSATPKQSLARQFPNSWTQSWRDLTIAQKLAWAAFASLHPHTNRFGQSKILSGFAWYESINYNLVRAARPIILLPPVYTAPPAVDVFTVVPSALSIKVNYAVAPAPANTYPVLWATNIIGGANTSNRSKYRLLGTLVFGGGVISFNVTAAWEAVFKKTWAGQPVGTHCTLIFGVEYVDTRSGVSAGTLFVAGEFTF